MNKKEIDRALKKLEKEDEVDRSSQQLEEEVGMSASYNTTMKSNLVWQDRGGHEEAIIGDFVDGDGVRFTLQYLPTCYRRGPWKLLVEVANGEGHEKWGCFDDQDQPMRYYHSQWNARTEAQSIANVLSADRSKRP